MDFNKLSKYHQLTKPGIVYGNLLTAAAGYIYASHFSKNFSQFILMILGLGLIIGSSCVINNIIDIEIDKNMMRTKNRALVTGEISIKSASLFAIFIMLSGSLILVYGANLVSLLIAMVGVVTYIIFYGYFKRKNEYGTIIGSIPGAIPPLVGFAAFSDNIDIYGVALFLIMAFWQVSHFYAIAIYRKDEYAKAKIPVWPIVRGDESTKKQIITYALLFSIMTLLPFTLGYCHYLYLITMLICDYLWLKQILQINKDVNKWAKQVFVGSLRTLLVLCLALSLGPVLP